MLSGIRKIYFGIGWYSLVSFRIQPLFTSIEADTMNAKSDGIRIFKHRIMDSFTADETSAGYTAIPTEMSVSDMHNKMSFDFGMFFCIIGITSKTSICHRQA